MEILGRLLSHFHCSCLSKEVNIICISRKHQDTIQRTPWELKAGKKNWDYSFVTTLIFATHAVNGDGYGANSNKFLKLIKYSIFCFKPNISKTFRTLNLTIDKIQLVCRLDNRELSHLRCFVLHFSRKPFHLFCKARLES